MEKMNNMETIFEGKIDDKFNKILDKQDDSSGKTSGKNYRTFNNLI